MDFSDSACEAAFRAEAVAFLDAHAPAGGIGSYTSGDDQMEVFHRHVAWQRTCAEHGWGAITWPVTAGGRGLGPIEQIIWNEECMRRGVGHSMLAVGIGMVGPTLIAHGTPAQQQRYLGPLLRAEETWCQLFSEPGAGSDLAALGTRAVRDGDHDGDGWVIDGQKTWSSSADHNDFGILVARTDPTVPKHRGLTCFVVDMKAPGIEVRPLVEMTGESHFNETFLNDVRVPDANRIGEVGQGWAVAQTTLMNERMHMGGMASMLDFEKLLALVRECHPDGAPAVVRDGVARVYTQLCSLELLNARMVTKLGRSEMPMAESSVMKLALAKMLSEAADVALQAMGPRALAREGFWQNEFLFAPAWHIAGGTDEIQKNVCAERVLGMPRDPYDTRDIPFEDLPRG